MGGHIWDLFLANVLLDDLAELEAGFLGVDSMWDEATLGVNQNSEELVRFFNCNNVHLTEWVSVVSPDLSINLDQTLLLATDLERLLSRKGVLQSLLEQHAQRNALSELVGTGRWSHTVNTLKLSKIPVLGSSHSFHNLSLTFIALYKNYS